MSLVKVVGVAAAAFAAMAAPALASTLTIGGGVASVSCAPSCAGIIGGDVTSSPSLGVTGGTAGSLSGSAADLYDFAPSDAANEAKALNILAGTNFTSGVQTDMGGASNATFSTVASWIALKIGNSHFSCRIRRGRWRFSSPIDNRAAAPAPAPGSATSPNLEMKSLFPARSG